MNIWKDRNWSPMLLGEVDTSFNSDDYIFELKFDGIRAVVFASSKEVKIFSRRKVDITDMYPELKKLSKIVKKDTIFDGEIIALENGKPSFQKLQERTHLKDKKKIERESLDNPIIFVCFDILYEDRDIRNKTVLERKKVLDKYEDNDIFIKSKYIEREGIKLFNTIKKWELEGIIAKRKDSVYEIDKRSDSWLKIKNFKQDVFYIGGYYEKEKNFVASLVIGEYRKNKFYTVGKVSVGKKNKIYNEIKKEKIIKNSPFIDFNDKNFNYVKPNLKCKVFYMERTKSNHLRQPFIK